MATPPRRMIQWILLCVLVLGVVGMHHVSTADDMPIPHHPTSANSHDAPAHQQDPQQPKHDMLHLCVAVICVFTALFLLIGLWLRTGRAPADRSPISLARPRAPGLPPPQTGRDLLGSLCVLRL